MRESTMYFCGNGDEIIVRDNPYDSEQLGRNVISITIKERGDSEKYHSACLEIQDLEDMLRIFKK